MKLMAALILLPYLLAGLFVLAALIYLIVKRVEERDRETFEKRDN